MRIRLLDNGTGVILSRQPFITHEDEIIELENAPLNSVVIYEKNGLQFYREIKNGRAVLPFSILDGIIKISVSIIISAANKWICEEIRADHLDNGGVLVAPNDLNLPQVVVDLKLENEALRKENVEIRARINALDNKLNGILEGYNII